MSSSTFTSQLPDLPIRCLKTADEKTTHGVIQGKNTVIGMS